MLTETRTRNKRNARETLTHRGTAYIVRSRSTYTFTAYRVAGCWMEPTRGRTENKHKRDGLARVTVHSEHIDMVTVARDEHTRQTSRTIVKVTVTGEYADVCEYLDTIRNASGITSLRDGTGMTWEVLF